MAVCRAARSHSVLKPFTEGGDTNFCFGEKRLISLPTGYDISLLPLPVLDLACPMISCVIKIVSISCIIITAVLFKMQ